MHRRLSITFGIAFALFGVGCSLILDLEPDCDQVSDCTPYVCNDENTACLVNCQSDFDCDEGFVCDRFGDTCLSQGCSATEQPLATLDLVGSDFAFDVARVDDSFWLIATSSEGVQLAELTLDGSLVGGSDDIIELDDASGATDAVAVGTPNGVTVFWQTVPEDGAFDLHVFRMDLTEGTNGPSTVYEGRSTAIASHLSAARLDDELLLAWMISPSGARPQIQLLPLNLDGTYGDNELETAPESAAVTVTDADTGSSLSSIAATRTRAALARRESIQGRNDVVVSFLDSQLDRLNDHDLSNADGLDIENIVADGMSNAIAVGWIEKVDLTPSIVRAVDAEGGTILGGTTSEAHTFEPTDLDLAAGSSEFALLWAGQSETGHDVFLRRFDEVGQPLYVAFSASSYSAVEPAQPVAVRTDDGYAAFWVEASTQPPAMMFRRFVCAR